MEQEISSPPIEAVKGTQCFVDFLHVFPDGVWEAAAVAFFAAIGWFAKQAFDAWNKSRLPFKQDRDRYRAVLDCVEPQDFQYLKHAQFDMIAKATLDSISETNQALSRISHSDASYLHKNLEKLEKELGSSVRKLMESLTTHLFLHQANAERFTIYWDNFDEWDGDQQRRAAQIEDDIINKIDIANSSFEKYRDYGNKLFANRLVKEKSDA